MKDFLPQSRIFRRKNVVFEIGNKYFDDTAVKRCVQKINTLVEQLDSWVLISIPDKSKGITPAAAEKAVDLLKQALKSNCEAVLILTSNTSGKIFAHALKEHGLDHKLFCSESLIEIMRKAETLLGDPTLFMDGETQIKKNITSENS
ncbi:hypothetical protein [Alteromonas sp. ASW11-130]|uniref:hypothetical protein n=1 Tax=Alteromonas sp. ASW11-130 TaxID=3015775 RepID=UPI0022426835|nr:hypothetical protein [Alteromonas sp. ASW11-130]MCW8092587.1 hypothetical protein [Alteromonas sp. ASW11-130]